ncbi:MFS transporter [Methylocapsa sp. S129]|uniref:MFS transporter n=1 Tax=Methylocapsa sp. S129 TaxID=1641869 RepID=UPI00131C1B0B|nr:MFS transporter [Methylocapsa sp. S129]
MQAAIAEPRLGKALRGWTSAQGRSLLGACIAHTLHDGYTDLLYVLLPLWQTEFGLSYSGLAAVRCLYSGTMGGLQIPGDRLIRPLGSRVALVCATVVAASGFLTMALSHSFTGLCVGLVLAGVGSSVQHPRGSVLVTQAYGSAARAPLGIYNFAGDLGKAIFPALVALLVTTMAWRPAVGLMALIGLLVALALLPVLPRQAYEAPAEERHRARTGGGSGFALLLMVGALDTATRMGYLLFLPFLLHAKGGGQASVGFGLAALFIGGALGKAACGWLGGRLGVVWSVIATEAVTACLIIASLPLSLGPTMVLLPLLGIVLNGTSSVLYGTVPELAPKGDSGRAFAIFYTGVIGSGALAPIAYGALADHAGQTVGVIAAGLTALATVPMILGLRHRLGGTSG